jgi:hypothetical protein
MATKRSPARQQWSPPPTEQLLVIEHQIRAAIEEGTAIKATAYAGGWGAWETNLGDLITRAFRPDSAQAIAYQSAGGFIADGPDARDFTPADYQAALVEWRDEKIDSFIAAAHGALKAIAQELERRGAEPIAPSLPARDFAFVRNNVLRAIAIRDYGELRTVAGGTVKAAAILAGSVIEAILVDALEQQGFTPKQVDAMKFVELIDEATAAKIIGARTQKAAHAVRDTRNFIHPEVERREGRLRKVDTDAAIWLMAMVLEDLA